MFIWQPYILVAPRWNPSSQLNFLSMLRIILLEILKIIYKLFFTSISKGYVIHEAVYLYTTPTCIPSTKLYLVVFRPQNIGKGQLCKYAALCSDNNLQIRTLRLRVNFFSAVYDYYVNLNHSCENVFFFF